MAAQGGFAAAGRRLSAAKHSEILQATHKAVVLLLSQNGAELVEAELGQERSGAYFRDRLAGFVGSGALRQASSSLRRAGPASPRSHHGWDKGGFTSKG
jgi:hypothetical protein